MTQNGNCAARPKRDQVKLSRCAAGTNLARFGIYPNHSQFKIRSVYARLKLVIYCSVLYTTVLLQSIDLSLVGINIV